MDDFVQTLRLKKKLPFSFLLCLRHSRYNDRFCIQVKACTYALYKKKPMTRDETNRGRRLQVKRNKTDRD